MVTTSYTLKRCTRSFGKFALLRSILNLMIILAVVCKMQNETLDGLQADY